MDLVTLSDEELLCEFKQYHSDKVFTELVRRHEPQVVRQCYRRLKSWDDAHDVAQEVFLRLFTKAHTYRSELPFGPWLSTIVNNRCRDHLRQDKAALHEEISGKILDTLEEEIDTEEVSRLTVEILQELLDQVSGEAKLILLLKYEQGWSVQAIHRSLSISEDAVKQRLKRSREKLKKLLDNYAPN